MRRFPLLVSFLAFGLAVSAVSAPPAPASPVGPVLTAFGAKFALQSGHNILQIKAETPLKEEAWQEIEALAPLYLSTTGAGFNNAALVRMAKLPLVILYMDQPSITDEGWAPFKDMVKLKYLTIGHNETWSGKGAAALANHPSLVYLNIGGSSFGDVGVPYLATIKGLKNLSLGHMRVTDAGLAPLANHPALETLGLCPQGTPRMTDAMMKTVVTLKALREFKVLETVLTYDGGLYLLKQLPNLKKVTLENVGLSDEDLAKLKAALPQVEISFKPWTPDAIAKWQQEFQRMKAAKK